MTPAAPAPARSLRIGLLTSYLALRPETDSGIGRHFRVLADALAALGHAVHVVHPTRSVDADRAALGALRPAWTCDLVPVSRPPVLDRLARRSWPAQVLLGELSASVASARALASAARLHRLEVVETHATATPALAYLLRPRATRVPIIARVSTSASQLLANLGNRSRLRDLAALLERHACRASDALLTHGRRHRDELARVDGYRATDFAIVPHGLPDLVPAPAPPADDLAEEILYVGRFEHRKGVDTLLDAIPAVLAARPRARLTLVGAHDGNPVWPTFRARHPDLADHRVRALGRVTDDTLLPLYANCSVFVAPSRYESFGLIYVEAMRHAKPVVGCRVGGVPDVVDDGRTGLLVPADDPPALADALLRLLADPALRARLGRAGREDFLHRFSARRLAVASAELYRHVADHAAGEIL